MNRDIPQCYRYRCIIYPTGSTLPMHVYLREADTNWTAYPYVWTHVDPSPWFPLGTRIRKLKRLPTRGIRLEHTYNIYFSKDVTSSVPNDCIAERFDQFWTGNIVVAKRSRADPLRVIHVGVGEQSLIDTIVYLWIEAVRIRRMSSCSST